MNESFKKKDLTPKSVDISQWYHDVVLRAGLADYSEVKGSMIIKPYGYAIWERIQAILDRTFKENGVQNVYFPIFIPYHLLEKEKEHLGGFSPELAIVTHAGGEKLTEPYVVRPTSETIMYKTFADWIQSYRDLPLKINQWANVVRWEKRTYPFLRTTEFLWQEGHTVHTGENDAVEMALKALTWYRIFYEEYLSVAPYAGIKSNKEKFAGAKTTYSIELVIPDGKALQGATSHNLSDNFAKVFDILFLDENGNKNYPYQTSWGLSTRAIGGLILSHGDDSGLILPPRISPYQVTIIAVSGGDEFLEDKLDQRVSELYKLLNDGGIRAVKDTDFRHSLGYRINEWELKGVPLRLEIGKRELEQNIISAVRRDTFTRANISGSNVVNEVQHLLDAIQTDLFRRSVELKDHLTADVDTFEEFKKIMSSQRGFIRAFWCEDSTCEERIKNKTKASTRILELEYANQELKGNCIYCGKKSTHKWLFAQSY